MKLSELGRGQTVGRCMSRFFRTPVAVVSAIVQVPWTVSPAKRVIAVPLRISAGSGSTRCWQSVPAVLVSGRIGSVTQTPTSVPRDPGSASLGSNHCPPANLTRCFDDLREPTKAAENVNRLRQ
jgi:hypothetical protein